MIQYIVLKIQKQLLTSNLEQSFVVNFEMHWKNNENILLINRSGCIFKGWEGVPETDITKGIDKFKIKYRI